MLATIADMIAAKFDWHCNNILKNPLSLLICGLRISGGFIDYCLKYPAVTLAVAFTIYCGLADVVNNTFGVFGTISDYFGILPAPVRWPLAILSAVSYFANNGWIAFINILLFLGLLDGKAEIDDDGVTKFKSFHDVKPEFRVNEMDESSFIVAEPSAQQADEEATMATPLVNAESSTSPHRGSFWSSWCESKSKRFSCCGGENDDDDALGVSTSNPEYSMVI